MIAYRGPRLIAEPELRWPILILAALITLLLAISMAGLYYVAMTQSDMNSLTNHSWRKGNESFSCSRFDHYFGYSY